MSIKRKSTGIAMTAVLMSALFTLVAAPIVLAATSWPTTVTTPRGGASTNTLVYSATENAAGCFDLIALPAAGPELQIIITDSAGASTVHFTGTPSTAGSVGSLGATASIASTAPGLNDILNINFAGSSSAFIENVTVTGLGISADAAAATGAIGATLGGNEAGCVLPGGTFPGDVGTQTITGTVATGTTSGVSVISVAPTNFGCLFEITNGQVGSTDVNAGKLVLAGESIPITAAGPLVLGAQSLTLATPTTLAHPAAEVVSQLRTACGALPRAIASPGTVSNALNQTAAGATVVLIGQTNQPAGTTKVDEGTLGSKTTLAGTITFTLSGAGVTFSGSPTATPTAGINLVPVPGFGGTPVSCSLSPDRTACSVTINTNDATTFDSITLSGITLDVAPTAVAGTKVKITITTSPAVVVNVTSNTIAVVGLIIIGTAAQPTVFIGANDQQTGTISLTESGPGFFTAGAGPTNFLAICYTTGESFTRAPWAIVTAGDLKLQTGAPGPVTAATQVAGTLFNVSGNSCAFWNVFSASTVASTIEFRGSDTSGAILGAGANNGPRINVPLALAPGSSQAAIIVGPGMPTLPAILAAQLVSNAVRAFQNSVTVTAASQPRCTPGATDCLAGNIVVTETQNGQLRVGTVITVTLVQRSTTQRPDVLLQTTSTNQTPIVATNAPTSGLLTTPVGVTCVPSSIFGVSVCNFAVKVTQQSFGPAFGTITFSNMHYVVAPDAVNGPVNVNVTGVPVPAGNGQAFDSVVSNAIIGVLQVPATTKTSATSAIGKTQAPGAFSVGTKVITIVASSNNIATIRIKVDPALVGKTVQIQVASKNSAGVWSAFANVSSRVIGSDGYAYYYATVHSPQWLSFRGMFAGNANFAASTGQTVQVRWIP